MSGSRRNNIDQTRNQWARKQKKKNETKTKLSEKFNKISKSLDIFIWTNRVKVIITNISTESVISIGIKRIMGQYYKLFYETRLANLTGKIP